MSRLTAWIAAALVAQAGCHGPIEMCTRSWHRVEGRIVYETPAVQTGTPVVETPLPHKGDRRCAAKIAIVDIDGLLVNNNLVGPNSLGDNPVSAFREKLQAIAGDSGVRAVVLRINSPGGGVTATDIMWREVKEFRRRTGLPVVACVMDIGAGGAYYVATAADSIIAHPTSVVGGIGVILNLYNLNELMLLVNIVPQPVKSGAHIDVGTTRGSLTPEAERLLQRMTDEFHARFKQVVREARALTADEKDVFDGRIFTALQALDAGLVDRTGYLDEAIEEAAHLAGAATYRPVMYHRRNDPAFSPYAVTPNTPIHQGLLPISVPGLERSRLPGFLYMWQPDATIERIGGH